MTGSKIKVTNFETLELEKQRLQAICEEKKINFIETFEHVKRVYPETVLKSFLPFNRTINEGIVNGAKWVKNTLAGFISKPDSKMGKFVSGTGGTILQAVLIYVGVRFMRGIFSKLK